MVAPYTAAESGTEKIELGWGSIAVRIEGASGLPWLVLSNSLATDLSMWDGQVARLLQTHRVLRYDTRGHGASSIPLAPYTFDDLAADVIAMMDSLGIDSATFVGLSLGGMTGLKMALDHPDRISRLVCCNAQATTPAAASAGWEGRAAAVRAGGLAAIVQETVSRWLLPKTSQEAVQTVAELERMILNTSVEGYWGCAEAIKAADFLYRVPMLSCPVAYIAGELDTGVPPPVMQEMARRTPGATYNVVPQSAHLANIDNPTAFGQILSQALELDRLQ